MRWLLIFMFIFRSFGLKEDIEPYLLIQNKPVIVGTSVTFTVSSKSQEVPMIAWDFGDDNGLSTYKKSLTISHTFDKPGVYQVFARIQGEDIPISVVQTVYKPVQHPRPTHSSTIVMDTVAKKIWVVNADNNSISCINAETYKLVKEVQVGTHPRTVAVDHKGNVWCTNEGDASVSIVSASGVVTKTIKMPYGSRPYGVCLDPLGDFSYVTLQGTGRLVKINASTQELVDIVEVGRSPRGIAISSDGKTAYVTQFISDVNHATVRAINTERMSLIKGIALNFDEAPDFEDRGRGVPNFISSITITPDGSEAWVPAKKDNTARGLFRDGLALTFDNTVRTIACRIDLDSKSEKLDYRIDINDADMANAVEFSPYGNIAFVALQGNNKIAMLELATNSRLGTLDSTGLAPQGLVLSPDGTRLFAHNFMSRTVKVYNTEDIILSNNQVGTVLATIPTVVKERLSTAVLRGKQIFYNAQDERMTFAGYISCASCHLDGGSDERVWDFTDRGEGLRNTHTLLGRRGTGMGNVHWTGNFDEIQDFENDMRNAFGGKGFLPDSVFNSGTVQDPLGDFKKGLSTDLDALAAYVESLDKVHPSPYRNDDGSLTVDAIEGKIIFANAGCRTCHGGPDFTDRKTGVFHDVGTILASSGKRRNGMLPGFFTPTLKGIWESAPYLHDGSAADLKEVLIRKNRDKKHGDLSAYSETEINKLVAYLLQIDESESSLTSLSDAYFASTAAMTITPNPADENTRVRFNDFGNRNGTLTVYHSGQGMPVFTTQTNGVDEITLDLSGVQKGVYVIKFSVGQEEKISKLVVK